MSLSADNINIPQLPDFKSVVDDSPAFHQSLKYWTYKSSQIGLTVHEIASSLNQFQDTGSKHHASGNGLSEVLSHAAQVFKDDDMLEEPFGKFSDALNRIECYRSMLLTQTQMLGVEPMMDMVKDIEKTKKCRDRVTKLSETMHLSWEKFAALPNASNLGEPQQLDRYAHNMITMRQKYQLLLAEYIEHIQDTNTTKKVALLQRVLEHMFAEFSYFNYCCQILKDLEPYMTSLFENLQKKQRDYEQLSLLNDTFKREVENKIDIQAQTNRHLFPTGDSVPVTPTTPSHFFNKVGGFISSGVKDLKKNYTYKENSPNQKGNDEPEWEVIQTPKKTTGNEECSQFYVPLEIEADNEEELPVQNNHNDIFDKSEVVNDVPNEADEKSEADVPDSILCKNKIYPINIPKRFETGGFDLEKNVSKRGYLRIKQRGFHKSKYPLLYFILDKGFGELLTQGQDQKNPRLFAKLMLTSVKACPDTDRNYCFVLTTSDAEFILQASNIQEYEEWMREIQDGIMVALDAGNEDRRRTAVRGTSIRDKCGATVTNQNGTVVNNKPCENVVERVKKVDGNLYCADCDCPHPGWASTNIGVVICIECSGIHRGLGVQVSKIKSLSLDKWDHSLVEVMEANGNTKLNKILEANLTIPKITRSSTKKERLDYIIAKYVNKAYCVPEESKWASKLHGENDGVFSDSTDDEAADGALSVMCLVEDCKDPTHTHTVVQ